ncbi:MAG: Hsp70 family protein [Bryobacteraceae bacterium]|nr:Hsp70 family protein [Bryobacteraceae bacterium]
MSLPVVIALALLMVAAVVVLKRILTPPEDQPHTAPPAAAPRPAFPQSGIPGRNEQDLLSWLILEASRQTSSHLEQDPLAMQRLLEAAAKAQAELDAAGTAEVNLPFLTADSSGPKHFVIRVTRHDRPA